MMKPSHLALFVFTSLLLISNHTLFPSPYTAPPELDVSDCTPLPDAIQPKILVLSFNPWLQSQGKSLFEYESSNNPLATSVQMSEDFCEGSDGFVDIQIASQMDRNEFPLMTNGKRMTEVEYLQLRQEGKTYSQWYPDSVIDLAATVKELGLLTKFRQHELDEIWMFLSWQMSGYESRMGGPGAFWINGPPFDVDSGRAFVVMGFENAAGVPNSLHSIGHRIESILDQAYGSVYVYQDTPWARFRKYRNSGWLPTAPIAAGDTENPPNATGAYDYVNYDPVWSTADDWLNYPNLTGAGKYVNARDWGESDYGYYRWWFRHFPRADGVSARADSAPAELRQNNWWKYIFQVSHYPELVGAANVEWATRLYLPVLWRTY